METEKKLTPELVLMAITSGMLDDSLDALKEVIRSRKDILNVRKSASLEPGDTFITQNVRPKKWEGLIVEFVRHEGIWLVCRLNEADARRIHNVSASLPVEMFREIKFRQSHVGAIFPKAVSS